jgi:hypothetical protein
MAQKYPGRSDFAGTVANVRQSNTAATPYTPAKYISPAGQEEALMVDPETDEEIRVRRGPGGRWQFITGMGEHSGVEMDTDEAMKYMGRFDEDSQRRAFQVMRLNVPLPQRDPTGYATPEELEFGKHGTLTDVWEAQKKKLNEEAELGRKIKTKTGEILRITDSGYTIDGVRHDGRLPVAEIIRLGVSDRKRIAIPSGGYTPRVKSIPLSVIGNHQVVALPYGYKYGKNYFSSFSDLKDHLKKENQDPGFLESYRISRQVIPLTDQANSIVSQKLHKWESINKRLAEPLVEQHKERVLREMDPTVETILSKSGTPHLIEANRHGLKVQIGESEAKTYKTERDLERALSANEYLNSAEKKQVRAMWKKRETWIDDKLKASGHKTWEDWTKADAKEKFLKSQDPIKGVQQRDKKAETKLHYDTAAVAKRAKEVGSDETPSRISRFIGWFHPENMAKKMDVLDDLEKVTERGAAHFDKATIGVGRSLGYLKNLARTVLLRIKRRENEINQIETEQKLSEQERKALEDEKAHLHAEAARQREIIAIESGEKVLDKRQAAATAANLRREIALDNNITAEFFNRTKDDFFNHTVNDTVADFNQHNAIRHSFWGNVVHKVGQFTNYVFGRGTNKKVQETARDVAGGVAGKVIDHAAEKIVDKVTGQTGTTGTQTRPQPRAAPALTPHGEPSATEFTPLNNDSGGGWKGTAKKIGGGVLMTLATQLLYHGIKAGAAYYGVNIP